jgi:hypothetical protein
MIQAVLSELFQKMVMIQAVLSELYQKMVMIPLVDLDFLSGLYQKLCILQRVRAACFLLVAWLTRRPLKTEAVGSSEVSANLYRIARR